MKVVDGDYNFTEGIRLVFLPGHSPGSQAVLVKTKEKDVLIAGDAFPLYENYEKGIAAGTMWICGDGTVAMKKQKNYTRSFCPAMSKRCLSAPYTAKNPNWVFKYIFGGKEIMKRKNGMILTFVLTGMVFIATVNAGGTQDASQKTKISIATVIPAGTPFPFGLEHMSKALNESGKFETSVYPGSQLGFAVGWF